MLREITNYSTLKRVIKMGKKICWGEVCKNDETIHIRTLVLIGLILAIAAVAAWLVYRFVTGAAWWNLPLVPTEF